VPSPTYAAILGRIVALGAGLLDLLGAMRLAGGPRARYVSIDHRSRSLRSAEDSSAARASRDLFLAQRFARHASPLTMIIYIHAADEDLRAGIRRLRCWLQLAIWRPEGPEGHKRRGAKLIAGR